MDALKGGDRASVAPPSASAAVLARSSGGEAVATRRDGTGNDAGPPKPKKAPQKAAKDLMRRLKGAAGVSKVAGLANFAAKEGVLDDISASFALSRLAKLARGRTLRDGHAGEALAALKAHLMENMGSYRARSLSTALHALAKLGIQDRALFEAAAEQVCRQTADYKPQEISMLLWAFANRRHRHAQLFQALGRQAVNKAAFFKPQELSTTMWAYATAGVPAQTLFMTMEQEAEEKLHLFKPQELANVAWAFATVSHRAPDLFLGLEEQLVSRAESLNPVDVSMSTWAFAQLGCGSRSFFRAMSTRAMALTPSFRTRETVALLRACAVAGHLSGELLEEFEQEVVLAETAQRAGAGGSSDQGASGTEMRPRDIATLLWIYGSIGRKNAAADVLFDLALTVSGDFTPQDISMVLSSCVGLKHREPALVEALAERSAALLKSFNSLDLPLMLWGFASLEYVPPELFAAASEHVAAAAPSMQLQGLAMCAWAYGICHRSMGRMQIPIGPDMGFREVFEALRPLVVTGASKMTSQGLVMAAQGFANSRQYCSDVFAAVELQVLQRPDKAFTPQGQSQILLAFAAVEDPGVALLDSMAESITEQVEDFSAQGLSNVMFAYARLNKYPSELFTAAGSRALVLVGEMAPIDISSMLWAFAKLGHPSEAVFRGFEQRAVESAPYFSSRDIASSLWSYTTAGIPAPALFRKLVEEAAARDPPLRPRDLSNLAWACSQAPVETWQGPREAASLRAGLLATLTPAFEAAAASGELWGRLPPASLAGIVSAYAEELGSESSEARLVLKVLRPAVKAELGRGSVGREQQEQIKNAYDECSMPLLANNAAGAAAVTRA